MQGKQAKIVSPTQERAILGYLETTRYPARDRVMFLLSLKAGLRAKAMASLTWAMVTDAQGQVADVMHVPNRASKGKTGGRTADGHRRQLRQKGYQGMAREPFAPHHRARDVRPHQVEDFFGQIDADGAHVLLHWTRLLAVP